MLTLMTVADVEVKTVRSVCEDCKVEVELKTLAPLHIEKTRDGGMLRDVRGRILCCPFCQHPLSGALYRSKREES